MPELPAVVAAIAAIGFGELEVAGRVLDDARASDHGGDWARDRLLLWRAWVSLQAQRPRDVDTALETVATSHRPLDPRDRLLADALRVGLARRYADETELRVAWQRAGSSVLHAEPDVFAGLPLGELAVAAARLGEAARMSGVLQATLNNVRRLGAPPVWGAHLDWAGIQQGILSNRPAALTPHAHALVAGSRHSRVCAVLARGGRVWTAVLTGDVDAEAIEASAYELAGIGLPWDGARIASHGAARTADRRVVARLLACARQLHPPQDRTDDADHADGAATTESAAGGLSAREREVATLVLQGLTYAEIGETIFISPRTAEHHIARIRQRLGATSRSDLIAKLRLAIGDRHPRREPA